MGPLPHFYGTMVGPGFPHTTTGPPPGRQGVSETVLGGREIDGIGVNRFRLTIRGKGEQEGDIAQASQKM